MGGQESFIYSFVARGTMVLAEYTEFTGNFPAIAAQCLQRLPSSNNKFTYKCDDHIFNFLVEDGYAFCVVAKESVGKQISIALLERIKADFKKRYGGGKADTAVAKSLNKEFGPLMKEHMQYIIDHADEIEKLLKVKAQVSEVKSIMLENIDKLSIHEHMAFIRDSLIDDKYQLKISLVDVTMERGEILTSLNDKAEDLRNSAQEYKTRGQQIRRKMWYQNMKIKETSTFTSTNIDESSSHAVVSYNNMNDTTSKNDGRIIIIQLLMWDFHNLQRQSIWLRRDLPVLSHMDKEKQKLVILQTIKWAGEARFKAYLSRPFG
ncbi:UNVERIFIED_CONTAM: Vesicle-associated membrane protein [Sesamum angustifolium]|uniref:Vesicle-associated membrane protein n=1 Tax=Sesamum angustifolium TaxID=2727405 RepID=A0AAW2NYL4_9LAMI